LRIYCRAPSARGVPRPLARVLPPDESGDVVESLRGHSMPPSRRCGPIRLPLLLFDYREEKERAFAPSRWHLLRADSPSRKRIPRCCRMWSPEVVGNPFLFQPASTSSASFERHAVAALPTTFSSYACSATGEGRGPGRDDPGRHCERRVRVIGAIFHCAEVARTRAVSPAPR